MHALRLVLRRPTRPPRLPVHRATSPWTARLYSTNPTRQCPKCGAPLPTALPTCPSCSYIDPPKAATSYHYYELLGLTELPNRFKIDEKELKRQFLQAQRVCHPDAWSGKGEREQMVAAAQSSELNRAYKTLLSPVERAQYILTQEGYPPLETDKTTDEEVIMDILQAREELEEAQTEEDVEGIKARTRERMREVESKIEILIEEKKWEEASEVAMQLKYITGIEDATREWRQPQQS